MQNFQTPSQAPQKRFDLLILPHRAALTSQARNLTHGALAEAEDLVQETLIRAYTRIHTISCEATVKNWLHTILKNLYINSYQKQSRCPFALSLDSILEEKIPTTGKSHRDMPESEILRQMEFQATLSALNALPVGYREPVVLADIEGLTYRDIADRLDIPVNTVRSRISRGRARLRRALYAWRNSGPRTIYDRC